MSGLYTATMGMISNMKKLDIHSNNIANLNTNGYKYDQETFKVFEETFMLSNKGSSKKNIGSYNHQMHIDNVQTNFSPGTMQVSSSPLDFALDDSSLTDGTSFFVIKHGEGEYLSRNGNFMLDAERNLSTANGGMVLGENGLPISIPKGVKFSVNNEGTIVRMDTDEELGKIQLTTVHANDLGLLSKEHGGYYRVRSAEEIQNNFGSIQGIIDEFDNDITLQRVFGTKARLEAIRDNGVVEIATPFEGDLKWNALEKSNASMSKEMLGIMEAQKGVQFSQKVFSVMDKVFEKEANEIGR
jgi:flagellar basal body rod protein FlgG